jgi:hypothetical protein
MIGVWEKSPWRRKAGVGMQALREGGERASALQAFGVSELRQGAAGQTTWTPVVGLADETSGTLCSAVYPSFARLGASRLPQEVQVEMA